MDSGLPGQQGWGLEAPGEWDRGFEAPKGVLIFALERARSVWLGQKWSVFPVLILGGWE